MQFENPMVFVRGLKGAPSSVLWALVITRQMMTALELQQWTGYKGDNLTEALRLLVSLGWVVARSSRGPWGLAEGWQLPLMAAFLDGADQLSLPDPIKSDSRPVVNVDVESEGSKENKSTTSTNKRLTPIKSESGLSGEELLNLAALKDAGIKGKKARALAVLPWVTPDYICAHAEAVKAESWDNPQGMIIYRIEGEEPAPEVAGKRAYKTVIVDRGKRGTESIVYTFDIEQTVADFMGHEKGCRCSDCRYLRLYDGDTRVMCPDCKHRVCECEESEEETL